MSREASDGLRVFLANRLGFVRIRPLRDAPSEAVRNPYAFALDKPLS